MQFKLTELFNTKYFYVTIGKDLTYLFNTCLELYKDTNYAYNATNENLNKVYSCVINRAPLEFDLADARITSDVCAIINAYSRRGLKFVDTQNVWRNSILQENTRRLSVDTSKAVPLPEFHITDDVVGYISSLQKDTLYIPPMGNKEIIIPLLTLIFIYRPSIRILLNDLADDVFHYVSDFFTPADLKQYSEFYISEPEGVFIWKKGEPLYIQRIREKECSFDEALTVADVVPAVFGKEVLKNNPTFRLIAGDCNTRLNYHKAQLPVPLSSVL